MKIRDLSTWESFYWVAKEANFTRAAKRLKVGVPLLSKRIAMLEEELGVRLFQRTTRRVSLTHDGQGILPQVVSVLQDIQGLEDLFQNQNRVAGTIRLTCVTAFAHRVLAPLITEFSELHPEVRFELEVTDTVIDLIDAQMDLGIRVQEPAGSDFVFKKLLPNNLVLCAAPSYLRSFKKPIRKPEDLRYHKLLMLKVYEDCRFVNTGMALGDLESSQRIFCQSGLFLTELACRGGGIAVRSIWDVYPLLQSGKLTRVLKDEPLEPFGDMYVVIPTRRLLACRVRAFIDFLESRAKGWRFS